MLLYNRLLKFLVQISMYVSILALVILVSLNLYEVTFRYLISRSNYWIQDVTLLLLMWVLFMGMVKIVYDKQDVFVDLLVNVLPPVLQRTTGFVVNLISLFFISGLFYFGILFMQQRAGRGTMTARIPNNLYTLAMEIACVLMDLIYIRNLIEIARGKTCEEMEAERGNTEK